MFKLGCLFAIILSGLAYGGNLPLPFRVVPQPKQVELLSGSGIKCTDLKSVEVRGTDKSIIMGPILSALPHTGPEDGQVSLEIASDNEEPNSEEGYLLIISKGKARIKSKGLAGLFYGCQTLEQMLQDSHDTGASLPACKIIDFPSYPYRAVQFDVKHHLDSIKYYYDCIDKLAQYKVNAIIFEFEDKLRYRRQPVVGSPQAMSMDEMAAMTRYAKERFIDISPLVQGLGHASYILKHEQYSYLREEPNSNWTFCPLQEDTYKVLFDLYRDAMEATPESRYLHIGGDEIGNIGKCPRCNQRCKDTGPLKLNLYWLNRVCEFVRQNGRIPILWDDMILKHADLYWTTCRDGLDAQDVNNAWAKGRPVLNSSINIFPKSSIYMRWNYSLANQQGNILALQWYCQQNLSIFIATAAQKTYPLLPQDDCVNNIRSFAKIGTDYNNVGGILCTAWDDSSPHMETYWRGFVAAADSSWSPDGRDLADFEKAYLQREFGPKCTEVNDIYRELFKAEEFWAGAFTLTTRVPYVNENSGDANNLTFIDLPRPADPCGWIKKYAGKLERARQEVIRYGETSQELRKMQKHALRNRYQLEVLCAINDLQITDANLLLALEQCDLPSADKKASIQAVQTAMCNFNSSWQKLRAVYGRTRFLDNPSNYVKDRYFHLASKREDLSWMVIVEEQFHKMVFDWLKENKLDLSVAKYQN